MHDSFLRALQTHRPNLRERWEVLLRAERVTSPMANPDALVHLMDWTLDRLFDELRNPRLRRSNHARSRPERLGCVCGLNPLLAYFATAEQALVETLFLSDGELASLAALERSASLEDLKQAMHEVARREIDSFCAVCQNKDHYKHLHAAAAGAAVAQPVSAA